MSDRKFWLQHVEHWQTSGLSQAEYARQNQLDIRKLNYYKRRLLSEQASAQPASLLPVAVTEPESAPTPTTEPASAGITLTSPGGFRIELAEGFDPQTLQQVITVLGAA